ncbi:hypothetical protein PG991_006771 [Apiospora marii]|uniref:Uncharacterized protein n=1 Tax=Apiospora marii TaxID=335849 RepID=A0ABR1RY91_9PEZI
MSAAKYFSDSDAAMRVKPTPERPLDAAQFYAVNPHVFKDYKIGDNMEVLAGCKVWEKAFQLPLKEAKEKHYTVLYELESETNSEFEFQAHLVLFLAMYGVTKLPEDQYCFATSAGPVLVRALALADYRGAQDYITDRLYLTMTRYFNRLVTWKTIPDFLTRGDIDKLYILDINETYIAYKDSNITNKKFPERAFANLIALHCPARAWGTFQSQLDDDLVRRVGTASMFVNSWLTSNTVPGNVWERMFLGVDDVSLFRPSN